MKREDNREERAFALLQALGDLNEEDVLRAEPGRGIRKRRNWGSIAAAAAFILVCGSVVGALYISWPMGGGQSGSTSGAPPVSSSGVTSGETGGAGSASGSDGAEGSAAEETFTVYLLDEAALDAGETDFDALAGTAGTLAVSGDEAELDGEPVTLPEGMPLTDGLIYAPERQMFIVRESGWFALYPAEPEDWPDVESGGRYSWEEVLAVLTG